MKLGGRAGGREGGQADSGQTEGRYLTARSASSNLKPPAPYQGWLRSKRIRPRTNETPTPPPTRTVELKSLAGAVD